jgi:hypothetical protein
VKATDGIIDSAADPALDDKGNTTDAEQQSCRFPPSHPLVQEYRSEHDREYRVGADDQGGKAGRYASHADVIEPEIERVIGDAKDGKHQDVATGKTPRRAVYGSDREHQSAGEQETSGQEQQRRTIRQRKFRNRKCRAPEQAERHNHERHGMACRKARTWNGRAHDALRPPWETYAPPLPFGNQIVEF